MLATEPTTRHQMASSLAKMDLDTLARSSEAFREEELMRFPVFLLLKDSGEVVKYSSVFGRDTAQIFDRHSFYTPPESLVSHRSAMG